MSEALVGMGYGLIFVVSVAATWCFLVMGVSASERARVSRMRTYYDRGWRDGYEAAASGINRYWPPSELKRAG